MKGPRSRFNENVEGSKKNALEYCGTNQIISPNLGMMHELKSLCIPCKCHVQILGIQAFQQGTKAQPKKKVSRMSCSRSSGEISSLVALEAELSLPEWKHTVNGMCCFSMRFHQRFLGSHVYFERRWPWHSKWLQLVKLKHSALWTLIDFRTLLRNRGTICKELDSRMASWLLSYFVGFRIFW